MTNYKETGDIYGDLRVVAREDGKRNLAGQDGELIGDVWFDNIVWSYGNRWFKIVLNFDYNMLNADGRLLSDNWFREIKWFDNLHYGMVRKEYEWNFIGDDGVLKSDIWFDEVGIYKYKDLLRVMLDGKYNYISERTWKLISDKWFKYMDKFHDGFCMIKNDNESEYNFMDENGAVLSKVWFNAADDFEGELAKIKIGNRKGFVNRKGVSFERMWETDRKGKIIKTLES